MSATTAQPKLVKGTVGFVVASTRGAESISHIYRVRVKMLRRDGTRVYTSSGDDVAVADFFLDADDAAEALERRLTDERDQANERLATIAEVLAKLDAGTIPFKDMVRD